MNRLMIIVSMIALIALAGPIATQVWADDAHHPEKAAKAKKSGGPKTNRQKRPAVKTDKSKQGELRLGPEVQKIRGVLGSPLPAKLLYTGNLISQGRVAAPRELAGCPAPKDVRNERV